MKKIVLVSLILVLSLSLVVGCEVESPAPAGSPAEAKIGMAYYNAHPGAVASAVAVVDTNGKVLSAYIDDIFYRNLNAGYVGLPGVDSSRITTHLVNPADTVTSKKNEINSKLYGDAMAKSGSTVTPIDNLQKIEQFAVGKTIAELEAVIAKDITVAKDEIQAATGATFVDNQGYLNTILLAAKDAQKSADTFTVSNSNNVVLKQAYYNAHGSPAVATAVVEGDTVVAAYIDEIYFFKNDGANVVFDVDAEKSLPKFVEGDVISSKKVSGAYGAALPGGPYVDQITAIEKFVKGKTVAELQGAYSKLAAEGAVVADVVSGATMRDTKNYIKNVAIAADPSLAAGDKLAQHVTLTEVKVGAGYFNAHNEAVASAIAVVDGSGTVVAAYLDDIFFRNLEQGYVGLPGVNSERTIPHLANGLDTLASKNHKTNSDLYGANMAKSGSTVLPVDNLAKIAEFAVGKKIDDLKAVIAKDTAKDDIQAVTGATFVDNHKYLNAIIVAAENAVASGNVAKVVDKNGLEIKQAYYNAHGSPAIATAVVEGPTIVGANIDELYFYPNDGTNVVFEINPEKAAPKFAEGEMLTSKKTNGGVYGAALPGGAYVKQIAAMEAFATGKTVAQIQESYDKLAAEGAVVADVVSGATMRDTKGYLKALTIAVDPSLAAGDELAQHVTAAQVQKVIDEIAAKAAAPAAPATR